jgi:hypothetical protein
LHTWEWDGTTWIKVADTELAAMTDQEELLAYEREHHGDPYMTLAEAKEMQRVALQFWHLLAPQRGGASGPRSTPVRSFTDSE